MDNQYFSIDVSCRENPACIYKGEDIKVDIKITNMSSKNVGFPLKYIKKRGPSVRLTDNIIGTNRPLRINLAPYDLLKSFTTIRPGESLSFDTTISSSEIVALREKFVDLGVEIVPAVKIQVGEDSKVISFDTVAKLRIVGEDTLKSENIR